MLGNEAAPWRETVMTVDKMRREADKRNESMEGGGAWRALDFVIYIFFVIILILSVRSVLFDTVRVDGTSMLDSLSDNDVMLVDLVLKDDSGWRIGYKTKQIGWRFGSCFRSEWKNLQILVVDMEGSRMSI